MMERIANMDYCYGDGCPLKYICRRYLSWVNREDLDGGLPPEWFIAADYDAEKLNCVNYVRKEFYGM